ncbi:hypothetical protein D3C85_1920650 [compost metagenome]
MQRKLTICRIAVHLLKSVPGFIGSPSKVLMYTDGSFSMRGSNTRCSWSTTRRSSLFSHSE